MVVEEYSETILLTILARAAGMEFEGTPLLANHRSNSRHQFDLRRFVISFLTSGLGKKEMTLLGNNDSIATYGC